MSTIHPREVNKACLSNKENKKTIIHYIQPHYPYLSYKEVYASPKEGYFKFLLNNIFQPSFRLITLQYILSLFSSKFQLSLVERVYLEIGIDSLYYYYEDNLRIVLKNVLQLIEELNGKTIITTDHGEAFGEQGIWGHLLETHIPVLIEVPWFEVKI